MEKKSKEQGIETRKEIYNFLVKYITKYGYAPTVREIADGIGVKSTSTIHIHLQKMEKLKQIQLGNGYKPRAIRLIGYEFRKVRGLADT